MKTYSTYQEAKIANPECDAIFINSKTKLFCARFNPQGNNKMYGLGVDWHFCNPADYCMSLDEFFNSGHKLTGGDVVIGADSEVYVIQDCESWNFSGMCDDNKRFILRAEALEKSNCTPSIHADSEFYKKPRTRVEYVKVNSNHQGGAFWECAKDYSEGVVFTTMGSRNQLVIESLDDLLDRYKCNNLYRKVETEIDERQEFIDAAFEIHSKDSITTVKGVFAEMFDSGKFKYIGGDDADEQPQNYH